MTGSTVPALIGGSFVESDSDEIAHWNVAIIAPPLIVSDEELEEGLEILGSVPELADRHCI